MSEVSEHSSLFESITGEHNEIFNESREDKNELSFRSFSEILFDIFPSIFMPYLDVKTFLRLLKTDLWNWHHLLSDRIVLDYCKYISIRHKEQIKQFCDNLEQVNIPISPSYNSYNSYDDYDSYDSSDTVSEEQNNNNSNINITCHNMKSLQDEEQNFAIFRIACKQTTEISKMFISNVFFDIDIISDRVSLTTANDIGLTTNLCKNITLETVQKKLLSNLCKNIDKNIIVHTTYVFDTFEELQNHLQIKQYFTTPQLMHIKAILITDILDICVDKWYFADWHQIKQTYFEHNQCFQNIQIKQMIIGHVKNSTKCKSNSLNKQELFVAWTVEWQYKHKN